MPYKNSRMPPVVRRTADDHYQIEAQDGTVVAECNRQRMTHPNGWWTDVFDAMRSAYTDSGDLAHDLALLATSEDWEYIDDR